MGSATSFLQVSDYDKMKPFNWLVSHEQNIRDINKDPHRPELLKLLTADVLAHPKVFTDKGLVV